MVENAHQYCAMFELKNENECLWRELINVRFQICGRITKEFIMREKKTNASIVYSVYFLISQSFRLVNNSVHLSRGKTFRTLFVMTFFQKK